MKDTLLKIVFLTIGIINAQGQTQVQLQTEDSLMLLIEEPQVDSLQIDILMQLATLYSHIDKVKTIDYSLQALSYDMDKHKKARILNGIGYNYWGLGKFNEAITYYNKSLTIFNDTNDSTQIAMVNNNLASAKWSTGKWNEALYSYEIALKIRKASNDLQGVSNILNNIGLIYQDFGVYDEALTFHNEALNIAVEINNFNAITYSYSNIGNCYKMKKEYESALGYHILGFKIYNENENNGRNNSYFLANIGMIYRELGKIDSALIYFTRSLELAKEINNEHRVAIAENNLGKIHLQLGEIETAANYINRSYRHALNNSYLDLLSNNQFALAEIEDVRGDSKSALGHFKNATALRDSLFNKEEISKFTELTIRRIQEKEGNEKSLLKENIEIQKAIIQEEKIIQWLLLAGGFLLLVILVYVARSRESIKKLNSKLLKSEEGFKQSNATKDQLFSIIAHDLRSPFTSIIGLSNILGTHVKNNDIEDIEKYSNMISDLSQKALGLISNLMEWALSQTDKIIFTPKRLDINALINKNVHFYADIARQKSITIINATKGSLFVNADNAMISTVLRNLISNAIKFTPSGGSINLSSVDTKEGIKFSVSDTGVGMTPDISSKIFDITSSYTTKGTLNETGSGFGLVICKEFIEKHQGKIWASSELNKGSEFHITLPNNTY